MLQLGKQIPVYIHRSIERVCTGVHKRGASKINQRENGGGGLFVRGQIKERSRFVENVEYTYIYRKQISDFML